MKILHYIDHDNQRATRFVEMLSSQLSMVVESKTIIGVSSRGKFLSILNDFHPDVVHIHSCWSHNAAFIQYLSQSAGYSVIISPHGQMMPKVMQDKWWTRRLPRILAYQLLAIRKCTLLMATSSKELKALKELGWRKRIALVRNPLIKEETPSTEKESAETLRALYQKIIDTNKYLNLSPEFERMFTVLVHASIFANNNLRPDSAPEYTDDRQTLSKLSAMEWTDLMLVATDRGVLDSLITGAKALGINPPFTSVAIPPRFTPKQNLKIRVSNTEQKIRHYFPECNNVEMDIVLSIDRLYKRINNNICESDKFRIWSEMSKLYSYLRFDDYNEHTIQLILRKFKLTKFAQRIMQIMIESHKLTEGFMPVTPIKDRKTKVQRAFIYTHP